MSKLSEEQVKALMALPFWSKIKDITELYELGILSQDKFNDELLRIRSEYKPGQIDATEMILIPAGVFSMGSLIDTDEKPIHTVNITKGFFIGKYEVTQGQWKKVMDSNPSNFSSCGDDCPVEQVSWNDVQACYWYPAQRVIVAPTTSTPEKSCQVAVQKTSKRVS